MLICPQTSAQDVEFFIDQVAELSIWNSWPVGDRVYFGAYGRGEVNPYVTDGQRIQQITNDSNRLRLPLAFKELDSEVYFVAETWEDIARDPIRSLFRIDGTGNAIQVTPDDLQIVPALWVLRAHGDELYFEATLGDTTAIYKTDGEVTQFATNVIPHSDFHRIGDETVFVGRDPESNTRLYRVDDNSVSPISSLQVFEARLRTFGDKVLFRADGEFGRELYSYDGQTVRLLADINPTGSSNVGGRIEYGEHVYFAAYNGSDTGLYRTDGVRAELVYSVSTGRTFLHGIGVTNDTLVLGHMNSEMVYEILGSDGENIWPIEGIDQTNLRQAGHVGRVASGHVLRLTYEDDTKLAFTDGQVVTMIEDNAIAGRFYPRELEFGGEFIFSGETVDGFALLATDGRDVRVLSQDFAIDQQGNNNVLRLGGAAFFNWRDGETDRLFRLSLLGDVDFDGSVTTEDIDLLSVSVLSSETDRVFDLNKDGLVDVEDRGYLIENILGTYHGDANLDGQIEFADFITLSNSIGLQGGWAQGDFDGNAVVGFEDFVLLANNYGPADSGEMTSAPEPTSSIFLWLLTALLARWSFAGAKPWLN